MSETVEVKPGEHGTVRVFAIDLPAEDVSAFAEPQDDAWPLRDALGSAHLDPDQVEVIALDDLAGLGLSAYLSEGHRIPDNQLADMKARLDSLRGHVLVLPSRAFGGQAQTLTPRAPLRLVGTFFEEGDRVKFEPLPAGGARGTLAPSGPGAGGDHRIRWRPVILAALAVLLLLALVVAGLAA
ncbi:aspartate carbamoyltransferase catalytic subunit [Roseovarius salinarum]|uniref:aspartate carbamoyltransferase catalytic subunit n=1 Tax=Roseovarius salinarum TaxID=1981892 RepID=UPI000C34682D|nr:aspartate carbamoyltransferase catalytic subunit [Roseovarius salinarum]